VTSPPNSREPQSKTTTGSQAALQAVRSAARSVPLEEKISKSGRVREGAVDTILNAASILRDAFSAFRESDAFFKYRVAVVAAWLVLTTSAVFIACPQGASNDIGAEVVVSSDINGTVYMIKNGGNDSWEDVEVSVNDGYRATTTQVLPNQGLTLSPAVLFDGEGQRAPSSFLVKDIQLKVASPSANVVVVKGGRVLE
jgi:hypothetical protein